MHAHAHTLFALYVIKRDIIFCISVTVIILAVVIITRRRKPDLLLGVSPEDDVRENVGYYDEEGAGMVLIIDIFQQDDEKIYIILA